MLRGCWVAAGVFVGVIAGCGGVAPSSAPRVATPAATPVIAAAEPVAPAAAPATPAPTWRLIYAAYFGPASAGTCGRSGKCHADDMRDAAAAYDWLARRGYIDGTRSALVSRTNSCLRWYGGNMPPQPKPTGGEAQRDLEAWVAAGAPDD